MSKTHRTDHHIVFPVQQRGDTLVVTPKGDTLGFSHTDIMVELRTVQKLLKQPEIRHLIIDLHGAAYFGSEMIGLINSLGVAAKKEGARIAMCALSSDMLGILRIMNLEMLWEFYRDRESALRAIATVPLSFYARKYAWWLATPAIAAAVALILINIPRAPVDKRRFDMFLSLAKEVKQIRRQPQSRIMREALYHRSRHKLAATLEELKEEIRHGTSDEEVACKRHLYAAGSDCLLPMLAEASINYNGLERMFVQEMGRASGYIKGTRPPAIESIQSAPAQVADSVTPDPHTAQRALESEIEEALRR